MSVQSSTTVIYAYGYSCVAEFPGKNPHLATWLWPVVAAAAQQVAGESTKYKRDRCSPSTDPLNSNHGWSSSQRGAAAGGHPCGAHR